MERAIAMDIDRRPHITITKPDLARLDNMIANYAPIISWKAVDFLISELKRARVVHSHVIPPTTVTMNSRVEFWDQGSGERRVATLIYPDEQGLHANSASILSPLGTALLGLSREQSMSYLDRDGAQKTITVLSVLYQPEAERAFRQSNLT